MSIIVTLAHPKGGVWKSTPDINLCGYFTQAGHKTALPQSILTALPRTFGGEGGREPVALIEHADTA